MYIVPVHLWNPDAVRAGVAARTISGGTSLSGDETVIQTDGGGRVEITYGEFDLDTPLARRAWDVWQDYMAGGARPVLVPVVSLELAPVDPDGPFNFVTNDDYFPTTAGYSPVLSDGVIVGDTALRSTTAVIELTEGTTLQPGAWFSPRPGRSHKIRRIISVAGDQYTVEFSPPLRAAVDDGDPVNMDWPTVQCRAVLGQDLIPSISQGRFGSVSVAFVEDFSEVA